MRVVIRGLSLAVDIGDAEADFEEKGFQITKIGEIDETGWWRFHFYKGKRLTRKLRMSRFGPCREHVCHR